MKIYKWNYTKKSVNNQKVLKFVLVLDDKLSVENAPKLSALFLKDKIFKIKVIQNISVTLRTFLTFISIKWVPREPSTIFLATIFAQKMPESSGFICSSILLLWNIQYYHFTWSGLPNSQEIVNLLQFSLVPREPNTKFFLQCDVSFWRDTKFLNQTVTLKCFPC